MSSKMTRRAFSLGWAVTASASAQTPAAPTPSFQPGIVPAGRDFWQYCDEVSALGFHRIEFNNTRSQVVEQWSERSSEFRDELAIRNLTLSGVALFSHLANASAYGELVATHMRLGKFLRSVGGSYITHMIAPGAVLNEPADEAEYRSVDRTVWARQANEIGRRLFEEYGVTLAYHPEQGEIRSGLFPQILEDTDESWFRLLLDTGHVASGGRDPVDVCRRWQKRLICVHLKDFHSAATPLKPGNVLLGEGQVDLPAIVETLRQGKFSGWVMAESGGSNQHMRDYLAGPLGLGL
jgi:inosose dehydratase